MEPSTLFSNLSTSCNNTTNDDQDPMYPEDATFKKVFCFVVTLVAIPANFIVILCLWNDRGSGSCGFNTYAVSVSFSDFLVGLVLMPGNLFMLYTSWSVGHIECILWRVMDFGLTSVSIFLFLAMGYDRYRCVTAPILYRSQYSESRAIWISVVTWCVGPIVWLPYILVKMLARESLSQCNGYYICTGITFKGTFFEITQAILAYFIPLLSLLILNIILLWTLHKPIHMIKNVNKKTVQHSGRRQTVQLNNKHLSLTTTLSLATDNSAIADTPMVTSFPTVTKTTSVTEKPTITCFTVGTAIAQQIALPTVTEADSNTATKYFTSLEDIRAELFQQTGGHQGIINLEESSNALEEPNRPEEVVTIKMTSASQKIFGLSEETSRQEEVDVPDELSWKGGISLPEESNRHEQCSLREEITKQDVNRTSQKRGVQTQSHTSESSNASIPGGLSFGNVKLPSRSDKKVSKSTSSRNTPTFKLVIMVFTFFIFWLPFCVVWPLHGVCPTCVSEPVRFVLGYWTYGHSACNPLIMIVTSPRIRAKLFSLWTRFR